MPWPVSRYHGPFSVTMSIPACVAAAREIERLPRAERDHAHLDAGLLLENWQDVAEEARLLGRGRRGDDDELFLRQGGQGGERRGEQQRSAYQVQGSSPLMKAAACSDLGL